MTARDRVHGHGCPRSQLWVALLVAAKPPDLTQGRKAKGKPEVAGLGSQFCSLMGGCKTMRPHLQRWGCGASLAATRMWGLNHDREAIKWWAASRAIARQWGHERVQSHEKTHGYLLLESEWKNGLDVNEILVLHWEFYRVKFGLYWITTMRIVKMYKWEILHVCTHRGCKSRV